MARFQCICQNSGGLAARAHPLLVRNRNRDSRSDERCLSAGISAAGQDRNRLDLRHLALPEYGAHDYGRHPKRPHQAEEDDSDDRVPAVHRRPAHLYECGRLRHGPRRDGARYRAFGHDYGAIVRHGAQSLHAPRPRRRGDCADLAPRHIQRRLLHRPAARRQSVSGRYVPWRPMGQSGRLCRLIPAADVLPGDYCLAADGEAIQHGEPFSLIMLFAILLLSCADAIRGLYLPLVVHELFGDPGSCPISGARRPSSSCCS